MKKNNFKVLGIIPARGGSKSIPHKNLIELDGRPLLQYTAESALAAKLLSKVILSTDDQVIADLGKKLELEVPFLRPKQLAGDNTPTLPVIRHTLDFLEKRGESYAAVCLLQPTSPLRQPKQIDDCIKLLIANRSVDSVVSILPVPLEYNPHWIYFRRKNGSIYLSNGKSEPLTRRQLLPPAFIRDGSIYLTRRDVIMKKNSLYGKKVLGYRLKPEQSVNIDTFQDLYQAEKMIKCAVLL